ncbi:MAG: hydroxyacid dehydrogenase [Planctomycetes bacterium]|nr:hydroxyacid dehydrogenase [Planctomycetota bacterium]
MPEDFDILVAESFDDSALERLRRIGRLRSTTAVDEDGLRREVPGADALLVRSYAQVTVSVIEAADRLKVIGRGGAGLDNVDLAAARRRGIAVVYTPAAASDSVAEFTVGLMLALERRLVSAEALLRSGRFHEARAAAAGRELRGLTLGIVGMGRIGSSVGRICGAGLGMKVRYNDVVAITGLEYEAEPVDKARIWAESDVITLHVPLTGQTRHLVDVDVLQHVQPGATLINTSRGPVVDGAALAAALTEGRLAGAALDVFEPEPPDADHPLLSAPNVLPTPHLAARTREGSARMNDVVDDVMAVLTGRQVQYPAPQA